MMASDQRRTAIADKLSGHEESRLIDADITIGDSESKKYAGAGKFMEFGFPSYSSHHFAPRPFLGIRGFMNFLNTMHSEMMR
jgi:nitrogenase molybdenum-iron protein alpha/beta subunit